MTISLQLLSPGFSLGIALQLQARSPALTLDQLRAVHADTTLTGDIGVSAQRLQQSFPVAAARS